MTTGKRVGNLILILFGMGMVLVCSFGYFRGHASDDWPNTEGTIISCSLEKKWSLPFRGGGTRGRSQHQGPTYRANISYSYEVEGTKYLSRNHHVNFIGLVDSLSGSRTYLEEILKISDLYQGGTRVTVYYDPDDPSFALLQNSYQGYLPTYLLFGSLAFGLGLFRLCRE